MLNIPPRFWKVFVPVAIIIAIAIFILGMIGSAIVFIYDHAVAILIKSAIITAGVLHLVKRKTSQ